MEKVRNPNNSESMELNCSVVIKFCLMQKVSTAGKECPLGCSIDGRAKYGNNEVVSSTHPSPLNTRYLETPILQAATYVLPIW
jgi:hypothetical protein